MRRTSSVLSSPDWRKRLWAQDWIQAADRALGAPQEIQLPLLESVFVDPNRPAAFAFRFTTVRGQVIKILIEEKADPDLRLFIDVFRPAEEAEDPYELIASAAQDLNEVQFEPRGDYDYILRLQPELLRGGRFTVSITTQPVFDFPVQGRSTKSILSPFGAPRDAGPPISPRSRYLCAPAYPRVGSKSCLRPIGGQK